jgi:hypothetical protein
MNNKDEIKNEYHKLLKTLNRTNKLKDEKTELSFSVKLLKDETNYLMATTNNEKFLNFGKIDKRFRLHIDPHLEFQKFAKYIQQPISEISSFDEINSAVRLVIHRLFSV